MCRLLASQYFWLFYAISLTLLSSRLFFLWSLMVGFLFSLFFFFRWSRLDRTLYPQEQRSYLSVVLLYPAIETMVKLLQIKGILSPDFTLTNRLEHFCWAIALPFFFMPLIANFCRSIKTWEALLFGLGFACLLGNVNEFLEYLLRIERSLDPVSFSRYYTDTILDMTMNLLGGLVGFMLLARVLVKPTVTESDRSLSDATIFCLVKPSVPKRTRSNNPTSSKQDREFSE